MPNPNKPNSKLDQTNQNQAISSKYVRDPKKEEREGKKLADSTEAEEEEPIIGCPPKSLG